MNFTTEEEIMQESMEFACAAVNNDTYKMEEILDNMSGYLDVNQVVVGRRTTALHVAVRNVNLHMTRMLLMNGADPNLKDNVCGTSLHYAVLTGRVDLTSLIASHKYVDMDAVNEKKMTPLHLAMSLGHYNVIKKLLFKGADVDICDGIRGNSPLGVAVITGDFRLAVILLNHGANVNYYSRNVMKQTVFQISLCCKFKEITQLLLLYNPDLRFKDSFGRTALHNTVIHQGPDIVEQLLERGAVATDVTVELETPMHMLFRLNRTVDQDGVAKIAKMLLNYGANINALDKYKCTPLMCAMHTKRFALVVYLLEMGADPNVHGVWSPLFLALLKQNNDLARIMIAKGANVNFRDESNRSLLCLVHSVYPTDDQLEMMRLLNDHGATFSENDVDGDGNEAATHYQGIIQYYDEYVEQSLPQNA